MSAASVSVTVLFGRASKLAPGVSQSGSGSQVGVGGLGVRVGSGVRDGCRVYVSTKLVRYACIVAVLSSLPERVADATDRVPTLRFVAASCFEVLIVEQLTERTNASRKELIQVGFTRRPRVEVIN